MTFRQYMKARRPSDDFASDFIHDALRDRKFPRSVKTWADLEGYLQRCGAIDEAVDGARTVWKGYRASLRRSNRLGVAQRGR